MMLLFILCALGRRRKHTDIEDIERSHPELRVARISEAAVMLNAPRRREPPLWWLQMHGHKGPEMQLKFACLNFPEKFKVCDWWYSDDGRDFSKQTVWNIKGDLARK